MARAPGIHLVHKPLGATSFSTLNGFLVGGPPSPRKPPKACHGGTLDPFADGLLLVLVGPATHLFETLHALPKIYEVEIAWGRETDNGDPTGQVVAESSPASLTPERIAAASEPFIGWHDQVPPATSAKKLGGEPAYRKAHRGEAVVLPSSRVYLHRVEWLAHGLPDTSRVRLTCRGGFYVRSFVRDLAHALGTHAHVSALRRTQIGPWRDPGRERPPLALQGPQLLSWAPTRPLTDAEVGALRQAQPVPTTGTRPPEWSAPQGYPPLPEVVGALHQGRLFGLLQIEGQTLRLQREFRGGL
ncbi:MAG: tRNA pseudouridine(55) synthase TruB [Myxococcota bacterium]|nr:tRNA pseudouridine(55) synthase TruB [Myxococcota bacterium]